MAKTSDDSTAATLSRREDILRKMKRDAEGASRGVSASAPAAPDWAQLGLLAEGLAFAGRPLKQATCDVTERYDLGPRGAWILNLISNGLVYPADLSAVFAVGRSLITAELVRLTAAGLVVGKRGDGDRRRSELALTPLGEAECLGIRNAISAIIHHNLRHYSDAEIGQFARMLQDVRGDGEADQPKASRGSAAT